jgi:hypothetical protein
VLPATVDHRSRCDRQQRSDGAVEARCGFGNKSGDVGFDADLDPPSFGHSAHRRNRGFVRAVAPVGNGERTQSVTHDESTIEVVLREAPRP